MSVGLKDFKLNSRHLNSFKFGGHPETGPLGLALAHAGTVAPHTGQALSEAMLFGLSGGIVVMYFVFEYKGFDARFFIGTRNTFDPMLAIYQRLKLQLKTYTTTNSKTANTQLSSTLESGQPALVWANYFSLGYNAPESRPYPEMMPVFVYSDDAAKGLVNLVDRARVPFTVGADEFAAARAAHPAVKNRLIALEAPPSLKHLRSAVAEAARFCANLFIDKPPKGPPDNFGLAALQKWANLLVDVKDKRGWARQFAAGPRLYLGLISAFSCIEFSGWYNAPQSHASRDLYANFLDEAAALLGQPGLPNVAEQFRASGKLWGALAKSLLPDSVPPFKEARELFLQRNRLFIRKGAASLAERQAINARLRTIQERMGKDFPLAEAEAAALRENLAAHVLKIYRAEKEAALALRETLGSAKEKPA